jgi:hypothetical protein
MTKRKRRGTGEEEKGRNFCGQERDLILSSKEGE